MRTPLLHAASLVALLVAASIALPAHADDLPGSNTVSSDPHGSTNPAATEGTVDAATGSVQLSIPIEMPAARGSVQPHLSLHYSSLANDGDAGFGWSWSLPMIERRGPSGTVVPTWNDDSASPNWDIHDTYLYDGRALVPICQLAQCTGVDAGITVSGATDAWLYRLQVDDGSSLRFVFSPSQRTWVCEGKDGSRSEFGMGLDGLFTTGTDPVSPHPYRWRLARQRDNLGNFIVYLWNGDQLTDIYDTPGVRALTLTKFAHHTHVEYERPPFTPAGSTLPWLWTPSKRVSHVDVTSANIANTGPREMVRRYYFHYADDANSHHHSWLSMVDLEGRCSPPSTVAEDPTTFLLKASACTKLLTQASMQYTTAQPTNVTDARGLHLPARNSVRLDTASINPTYPLILDLNADGFPDMLSSDPDSPPGKWAKPDVLTVGMNTNGGPLATGSLVPSQGSGYVAVTWQMALRNVIPGEVTGDGLTNFFTQLQAPWDRDPLGNGDSNSAADPPYTLDWQTLSIAWPSASATSGGMFVPAASGNLSWSMRGTSPNEQIRFQCTFSPDLNGDGIADCLGGQAAWGHVDDGPGNFVNFGVLFGTKDRLGRVTPLGAPQVKGAIPQGIAWMVPSATTPWTSANDAYATRNNARGSKGIVPPRTPAFSIDDMDGDGLPDVVVPTPPAALVYWHNNGDGTFGNGVVCTLSGSNETCDYGEASGTLMPMPDEISQVSANSDNVRVYVHDMNGDGLGDLVYAHTLHFESAEDAAFTTDGVEIALNHDGSSFELPLSVPASAFLGAWGQYGDDLAFADMNGNGSEDIIALGNGTQNGLLRQQLGSAYVDIMMRDSAAPAAARPGLLTSFVNAHGGTQTFSYATIPQLWAAVRGTNKEWGNAYPKTLPVVTQVLSNNGVKTAGAQINRPTTYEYRDPVYDAREHTFRGFRRVRASVPRDSYAPDDVGSATTTTFLISNCPVSPGKACTQGIDDAYQTLRALPLVTEQSDDTGAVFLSTTHRQYAVNLLAIGADGRKLRLVYPEQTDTFLYDTAGKFAQGGSRVTVVDVHDPDEVLGSSAYPLPLQATSYVHTRMSQVLDSTGNATSATNYGILGIDTPMLTTKTFTKYGDWTWRTQTSSFGYGTLTAPPADADANERTYVYDTNGTLTDVYATLVGSQDVHRFHATAGAKTAPKPANASVDGQVLLTHVTSDPFGNPTLIQQPDGRCVTYVYDPAFFHLPTTVTVSTGPFSAGACGTTSLTSRLVYDRALGQISTVFGADSTKTDTSFDPYGRVSAVFRPDPLTPNASSTSAAVTYDYHFNENGAGAWEVVTTTLAGRTPGTAGTSLTDTSHTSVAHYDGFDRLLATVDKADASHGDGAPWIISGAAVRTIIGTPYTVLAPQFWSGADPIQAPLSASPELTGPRKNSKMDAFGRVLSQSGFDGKTESSFVYHAISSEEYDAEQQPAGLLISAGANYGLHSTKTLDGFGRTVATTSQVKAGTAIDTITTQITYLATDQTRRVTRSHSAGVDTYVRSLGYDSLNRLITNNEPNTTSPANGGWVYQYDDAGDLVGTSDARGCGENFTYDAAGRLTSEDYSPCVAGQPDYTQPDTSSGDGTEAWYLYDTLGMRRPGGVPTNEDLWVKGRLGIVSDRAASTHYTYDGRGRAKLMSRRIAVPGVPSATLASRFAPHVYQSAVTYDEADRERTRTTGADVAALLDAQGTSAIGVTYTARGMVDTVTSSYGSVLTHTAFDVFGRPLAMGFGDVAGTNATYTYDSGTQRLAEYAVQRAAPSLWKSGSSPYVPAASSPSTSLQTLLIDDQFTKYDRVGNPLVITDNRSAAEWPSDARPVTRTMAYDALYRLTSIQYATTGTFTPPLQNVPHAAPPVTAAAHRLQWQSYTYDWQGNITSSNDDGPTFFERSLGTQQNGQANGLGPNQLRTATSGTSKLDVSYDDAGNVRGLITTTSANGRGAFVYEWDEVGRLAHAQRFDPVSTQVSTLAVSKPPVIGIIQPIPIRTAAADLVYSYDHAGNRVISARSEQGGEPLYAVRVFDSLRLDEAHWVPATSSVPADYERTQDTESVHLVASGAALARVIFAEDKLPETSRGKPHMLLQLGDHLGSTAVVIDHDTSELVERSTYEAYGHDETDYRPARWGNFRESFRFTGKENDVEVGLHYFGARYYSPHLGRWISPDPLTIHGLGADLNPYAYVGGNVLAAVDPIGLALEDVSPGVQRAPETVITVPTPMDQTGMNPYSEGPGAMPFEPPVSDPTALENAEHRGWMELGDMRAFAQGLAQREPEGNRFDGANEVGRQFARDLAYELGGALVAWAAPIVVRGAQSLGRGIEAVCEAGLCPCFVEGTSIDTETGRKPIEACFGDRAGPALEECVAVDFSAWREVDLAMTVMNDGVVDGMEIRLLRPEAWFAKHAVLEGGVIQVNLDDLNVSGTARVTKIGATGHVAPGSRCPVTGWVRHTSRDVIPLVLENGEKLRVTRHHRLFSADRHDWVHAGDLNVGEALETKDGIAHVVSVGTEPSGATEVFNLEVIGAHRYFVGELGVLAHNAYIAGPLSNAAKDALRLLARETWAARMGQRAADMGLQVHHRIPLEYAHLFPQADPNRAANLIGVAEYIHSDISAAWGAWRNGLGRMPTAAEVMGQASVIDQMFAADMVFLR